MLARPGPQEIPTPSSQRWISCSRAPLTIVPLARQREGATYFFTWKTMAECYFSLQVSLQIPEVSAKET
jgi:hypothetical protein